MVGSIGEVGSGEKSPPAFLLLCLVFCREKDVLGAPPGPATDNIHPPCPMEANQSFRNCHATWQSSWRQDCNDRILGLYQVSSSCVVAMAILVGGIMPLAQKCMAVWSTN